MIINNNKTNIGLVFEAAVAYLSRESWQPWLPYALSTKGLGDPSRKLFYIYISLD